MMETFCLPLHEINDRFTRSELYMVAWRSQEQHHHFKRKFPKSGSQHSDENIDYTGGSRNVKRHRYGSNDLIPEGLPEEFYAKEEVKDKFGKVMASPGEINLSQVTGEKARKYMAAIGMHFPEIRNVVPRR